MRKKILYKSSSPQPGKKTGLGKFQNVETHDQAMPPGVHPPPADQRGTVCRCNAGNAETAEKTRNDNQLGIISRIAIIPPLLLIRIYQLTLSPYIGKCCRFTPSCSRYSAEAFKVHGFWRGMFLTAYRILRCQPFCRGGYDPVPEKFTFKRQNYIDEASKEEIDEMYDLYNELYLNKEK